MENLTFVTPTIANIVSNVDTDGVNFVSNLPYSPRGEVFIHFSGETVRYMPTNDLILGWFCTVAVAVILGGIIGAVIMYHDMKSSGKWKM
jgi:hypothetical protein